MIKTGQPITRLLLCLLMITAAGQANAELRRFTPENPADIFMVVWRGCEEACQGFKQYLAEQNLPVRVTVRDVAKDKKRIPEFLAEAQQRKPDLVVTWGTSVSKGIIGPMNSDAPERYLNQEIPALFMVVADPVGAGIINAYDNSGRPHVTGVRNRVPEEVQIRAIQDYLDAKKIGVIYTSGELNSVLNTQKLEQLSESMDFELVQRTYQLNDKGKPVEGQIPGLMQQLADEGVDVVYVGSSSYNRQKRDEFSLSANQLGLPVASAYEVMVTRSHALISIANRYYNVGRLAGSQARKVLFDRQTPGHLKIPSLSRYSVFINMAVARQLELYPPIQLLRFAELVNTGVTP